MNPSPIHRLPSALNRLKLTPPGRVWLLLTLAYLLIAVVVTYPAALHLGTQFAGDNSDSSDVLETTWGIWWWKHALLDLHQSPLQISVLNYPGGLDFPLYPLYAQTYLLALPLAVLASPAVAYNLLLILSPVACGLAGYALSREITDDAPASFVGGLIWAFFPARMIQTVAGHLPFVLLFSVPLAAWGLISTLKAPTLRKGVLTALALAATGTMHPSHLPYVIAPLVIGLTVASMLAEGRAFWRRDRLQALLLMAGLTAALMTLLLLPILRQMLQGNQAVWSPSADVVGFSPDALGFFVPSADNPLIRATPLAQFAVKVQPYQYVFLIYAGWLTLLLAAVGAGAQPAKSRPWLALALGGAIFALGPLLKVGGDYARVWIAGDAYRIVMPYALVMNWPFVQWSRTPGRLAVLVMLALSVLAALGLSQLLKRFVKGRGVWLAVALVSAGLLAEDLVRYPFPTFSANVPVAAQALRTLADGRAVVQVPVNGYKDNQRALYWQTVHQQPLVGGRVYRDETDPLQRYDLFRRLLLAPESPPGAPTSSPQARQAALASAGIGWVIYDAAADPQGTLRGALQAQLGQPLKEDGSSALFKIPAATSPAEAVLWQAGANWEIASAVEDSRRFCRRGEIGLFAANALEAPLTFSAFPASEPRRLTVSLNHQPAGQYVVGDMAHFQTPTLKLVQGLNVLEFEDGGPLPSAAGNAAAPADCTADGQTNYTWGPTISNLQFADRPAKAPFATFGSAMQLLEFSEPDHVRVGQSITLHLIWQAAEPVGEDLTAFVHLEAVDGRLVAQQDAPPLGETYPTSQWKTGEVIATTLTLPLPADLPAGIYHLGLGLYRLPSVERLPVSGAAATDDMVSLGQVTIEP